MVLCLSFLKIVRNSLFKEGVFGRDDHTSSFLLGDTMKLSKYSRLIPCDSKWILFNSTNKAVVLLDSRLVDSDKLIDDALSTEEQQTLRSFGFFLDDKEAEAQARHSFSDSARLSLSIELSLDCNLRCPYCYQGNKHRGDTIKSEHLNQVKSWLISKITDGSYREIVIKVLGGEPALHWQVADGFLRDIASLCSQYDTRFVLMIDTNATIIEPFKGIDYVEKLLFTIPLSHRSCHDEVRKDAAGDGTYDKIISNIKKLKKVYPDCVIVLRHNTDDSIVGLFADYLEELKKSGIENPYVDITYTANFETNSHKNKLVYREYLDWRMQTALPLLVEYGFPVLISPVMNPGPCQNVERSSFKLFSDGTVGYCAMDFFSKNRQPLTEALLPESLFFKGKLTLPETCYSCGSFFLCGGSYYLPCIRSLGVENCEKDGAFNVDLEKFLQTYVRTSRKNLFVVFNQNELVR